MSVFNHIASRKDALRACALAGLVWCAPAQAQDSPRCEELAGLAVPPAASALAVRGVKITSAQRLGPSQPTTSLAQDVDGELRRGVPARCLVLGEIAAIDPDAPPIRFSVNLPFNWNGKALHSGGGGFGGAVITAPGQKASGRIDPVPLDKPYPIELGYATFGGDGGHQGNDPAFLKSDEALRNWAGDALKKTRDVALRVIEAAYGREPRQLYFTGESAGGREALWLAQRYPQDYDGFIATSPVLSWTYIHLADAHIRNHLIRGFLDAEAIKLVAERTRATCDAADGLKDGVIARYMECPNDVAALRCTDGKPAKGCLSDAQIASVNALRQPWSMPVTLDNGIERYPGFGVSGDEDGPRYQWDFYGVGKQPPSYPLPPGVAFERGRGAVLNFAAVWVRYAIAQDPAFEPYEFDPTPYRRRIQYLSSLIDATNPDLSGLRARRGRLIVYQPSADTAVGTPMVAEYYRSLVAKMGSAATEETMRFYVGPGGGHNATGMSQIDTLAILENWVEKGETPPERIAAADIDPETLKTKRTMPACRYPAYARYNGSGDPDAAASFTCTQRADPLAYRPLN